MMETLLTAILGGAVSGAFTVAALKVDVKWIKDILKAHEERILLIERKV